MRVDELKSRFSDAYGSNSNTHVDGHIVPGVVERQSRQQPSIRMQEPAAQDVVRVLIDLRLACEIALSAAEAVLGQVRQKW